MRPQVNVGRRPHTDEVIAYLCLTAAFATTIPALGLLAIIWDRSEYLAHGYLIPAVSLGLLYMRRATLRDALRSPAPPASGALLVGLAATWEAIALAGEVATAAGMGIPLLLGATSYAIGGGALLRATALPLGFLLFMVPPPGFVQDRLLIGLKSLVIQASVEVLQLTGHTVVAAGNRLLVPGHELFMADACSGLTTIVTLLPLGAIIACFFSHGWARRAVILCSIIPLAVVLNIVRVIATVVLVGKIGEQAAVGLAHESLGFATFLLGTGGLLGLAKSMR